jgi:hypothetical protein
MTPRVGDRATLHHPSDSYPYIVRKVSPSGRTVMIQRLDHTIVSGSFHTNDAVVEYSERADDPKEYRRVDWSPRRNRYTSKGTPVSFGNARYYQAPEV